MCEIYDAQVTRFGALLRDLVTPIRTRLCELVLITLPPVRIHHAWHELTCQCAEYSGKLKCQDVNLRVTMDAERQGYLGDPARTMEPPLTSFHH